MSWLRCSKIPNIAGYKFTEYNLYTMQRLLARFSPDQIMYNGPDEMLAHGLAVRRPRRHRHDVQLHARADRARSPICAAKARLPRRLPLRKQANEVIEPLLLSHGLAATKQILVWQGLIDHPHCAIPRALLSERKSRSSAAGCATAIADTLVKE